ncbi:hypothetical protein FJT64_010411 [Amphibalanus amphitrite]|uniref:Activin types I and II receptor domain-containing protein n=1 Tax=Amphibalanus amphitrite TaxID=1232801 RepID=A0A6A4VE99_AMPAM|nr:hypothetical protein FJT64_010411 [Amphibalanus amphitrite]
MKRDVSRSIVCICTTLECQQAGVSTCTTTGMCYTQQLRRLDGADPMTRGCVRGETPLMCDHLLPTHGEDYRASSICCGTPLCNKQVSLASGRGRGPGGTRRHEQHEQRRTNAVKHGNQVDGVGWHDSLSGDACMRHDRVLFDTVAAPAPAR